MIFQLFLTRYIYLPVNLLLMIPIIKCDNVSLAIFLEKLRINVITSMCHEGISVIIVFYSVLLASTRLVERNRNLGNQ